VGGGAAGAIAAIHLERRAGRRVRVVIIEPRAELGGGVAYSTTDLGHLLNVRAECLSALPDQPGHFSAWAAQRTPTNGQPFLPRAWYGQYLRSLLGQVEHIRARAAHVGPCAAGVQIALSNGTNLIVDRVVLATGPSPTTFPEGLGGGELRWIEDPWVPGVLDGLRPDEPVSQPSGCRAPPDVRHVASRVTSRFAPTGSVCATPRCSTAQSVSALIARLGPDDGRGVGRLAADGRWLTHPHR
jgi:uncharacterized NAD(P)/FAD-binding protein YdhS